MTESPKSTTAHRKLFGTDGIRGRAGDFPLDPATMERVGGVIVEVLENSDGPTRILIGRDTRESGAWLQDCLCRGISRAGGTAVVAGVVPTPAIAHLTASGDFRAGIVISASHNPYQDNGIKIISGAGFKLEDGLEAKIERRLLTPPTDATPRPGDVPAAAEPVGTTERAVEEEIQQQYMNYLLRTASRLVDYRGTRLALDCANGAAFRIAPQLFSSLGMEVHSIGTDPSGRNINQDCGSIHPDRVATLGREVGADLGLALDGDADRAILVDRTGCIIDGDHVLYLTARSWKNRDRLRGDAVVGTVMANQWLERALSREGIRLHRAPVGDRYVLQEMQNLGCNIGGEPSGHLIFLDHGTTGDGLLTTLMLLDAVAELGIDLADWAGSVEKFPQRLVNIPVTCKPSLEDHPVIAGAIREQEKRLGDAGRLLVRYSGTEPLVRLMVEAERIELVDEVMDRLGAVLRTQLGDAAGSDPGPGA
jgi:phosphoglucosamine mutase